MIRLKWMNDKPEIDSSSSWGMPWEEGKFLRENKIKLKDQKGKELQADTWPMAFWPDGSIKWSGHASNFNSDSKEYTVEVVQGLKTNSSKIVIKDENDFIIINNNKIICKINKKGNYIVEDIEVDNKIAVSKGSLVVINENRTGNSRIEEEFISEISNAKVEHLSDLKCVVKLEGIHKNGLNTIIPFKIRLEFYYLESNIKFVHTFFYDGDKNKDFIKAVGIKFETKLKGNEFNKKVAFSLEEGMYSESSKLLLSRFFRYNNSEYKKQIELENVNIEKIDEKLLNYAKKNTIWNDFRIIQNSSEYYKIQKRSEEGLAYIDVLGGSRSKGMLYIAGEELGLSLSIKDFWQKNPCGLEVKNLSKDNSELLAWLWEPTNEPMDFRHYSNTYHMSAYEGFEEVRSDPYGIANTSEIFLNIYSELPNKDYLYKLSEHFQKNNLLICDSETYYKSKATGLWGLKSKDILNPIERKLEEELENNFNFYVKEIEQRKWYGYWNYGDIMHTYDQTRNQWMYDMGGYAWQNTELMPNVWLWYHFFRTLDSKAFDLSRAMTRHNSEVDCYHFGQYKGLGSRHNVIHWGCSCKEARINMSLLYKYFYYLTCDERTGEILEESVSVNESVNSLEPLRGFFPGEEDIKHIRIGPDWSAYCSNWQTQWERTNDVKYRDKILQGIEFLKEQPLKLLTGPSVRYEVETNKMENMWEKSKGEYHMAISFGAPQIWIEISNLLNDEEWKNMIAEFGLIYGMTKEERKERLSDIVNSRSFDWPEFATVMMAFSANLTGNKELANKAWRLLFNEFEKNENKIINIRDSVSWNKLEEDPLVTTNCVSQWSLNTIICLEYIKKFL